MQMEMGMDGWQKPQEEMQEVRSKTQIKLISLSVPPKFPGKMFKDTVWQLNNSSSSIIRMRPLFKCDNI